MKRFLVSALILAMVLGFGATAFAAAGEVRTPAFSDIAGHEAENDLALLGALGIFSGENGLGGAVKPNDPITRAQFCKVVVVAAGRGTTAQGLAGLRPTFADEIPSWAWGYVNAAVYMGIIKGYEDGTFRANNPVTYAEAVTMLIRATSGHEAQVPAGNWPYNYLFYGVDNGFTGSVDVGFANLACTRGDMARLLFATMQVNKLDAKGNELKYDEEVENSKDTAILAGRLFEGAFKKYDAAAKEITIATADGDVALDAGDPVYLAGASSFGELLGLNVIAVLDQAGASGKAVFVGVTEAAGTVRGVFKEYVDSNDEDDVVDSYKLEDGTVIPFTGDTQVAVNGAAAKADSAAEEDRLLKAGDEVTIILGENGKAASVSALRFDLGVDYVDNVSKSNEDQDRDTVVTLGSDAAYALGKDATVTVNGASADRDSLAEWDVVELATFDGVSAYNGDSESASYNPIYAVRATRKTVEGTVAGTRVVYPGEHRYITIEGKEYAVDDDHGYIGSLPAANSEVRYAQGPDGALFVNILYAGPADFVLFKSYTTGSDGTFVTVDVRGVETTFKCEGDIFDAGDLADYINSIGELVIDPENNQVTGFDLLDVWGGYAFDIVGIDNANKRVTLARHEKGVEGVEYSVLDNPVVYKVEDGVITYVPFDQVETMATEPGTYIDSGESGEPVIRITVSDPRPIEVGGEAISSVLSPTNPHDFYTFQAIEGHTYRIRTFDLASDNDTYLHVFADGTIAYWDDDGGGGLASLIEFDVDSDGTVTFSVGTYSLWDNGGYSVEVTDVTAG